MRNTNLRRILIPVDFLSAGERALNQGTYLANIFRADIVLLHTMEGIHTYPHAWFTDETKGGDKEVVRAKVAEKLSEYAENITKKYGVYVKTILLNGSPVPKIAETVKEEDIDLIVMGTHGAKGFEELFLGSTANKVVNLSPCPVITIREAANAPGFKSIVLPIDESMHSRQKVTNVLPIAAKCNAVVHILGLIQSDDKSDLAKLNVKLSSVEDAVQKAGVVFVRKVVKTNNIAVEAIKYAEDVNAELIAIMTDHESNMTGMFMGAFARQIVNHSKVPVLSIKPITGPYEAAS